MALRLQVRSENKNRDIKRVSTGRSGRVPGLRTERDRIAAISRRKFPDIQVGDRFGHLVALETTEGLRRHRSSRIQVHCDCGNEYPTPPHRLWIDKVEQCKKCSEKRRNKYRRRRNAQFAVGTVKGEWECIALDDHPPNDVTVRHACGAVKKVNRHFFRQIGERRRADCCPTSGISSTGYPMMYFRGEKYLLHRYIWENVHGRRLKPYPQETVHHVDGDKMNFHPDNLQLRHGSHGQHHLCICNACGSDDVTAVPLP